MSVHDAAPALFPETFTARGRWFHAMGMRAAARRADRVITGSRAAASELLANTPLQSERVRVVPYGVDSGEVPADQLAGVLARYGLAGRPTSSGWAAWSLERVSGPWCRPWPGCSVERPTPAAQTWS